MAGSFKHALVAIAATTAAALWLPSAGPAQGETRAAAPASEIQCWCVYKPPPSKSGLPRWHVSPLELCDKGGLFDHIYFAPGSAVLEAKARVTLDKQAYCIRKHDWWVYIEARADPHEVTNGNASMRLSEQRVAAAKRYLIEHDIAAERLRTAYLGWYRPVVANARPDARWKNRFVRTFLVNPPRR
jgi:outer membrane protein OmpA-like peptidoglycan-associated protein